MKRIELNGLWQMTGNGYTCSGQIPGSVYSFLMDAGLAEDPYYRDNELWFLELMQHDYTFTRTFVVQPDGHRVKLCCDGLDTLCTIRVNGAEIASVKNMHRRYEFDITEQLLPGDNELSLCFASPTAYIKALDEQYHCPSSIDTYRGFPYIRKAYCMYGWDWGPMLPDAGIWRDIYLLIEDSARITDVRVLQRHEEGRVFITATAATSDNSVPHLTLTAPDGTTAELANGVECEVENPQLWWPNGMGEQPLYTVTADILQDGEVADRVTKRIGLRTLELVQQPDEYGESFYHRVNGIPFFAMGADYIPEDNILSRITADRTRWLLEQGKRCHFNAIRVWGGGYYPDDFFFDICDELGLIVFFDMMVACCLPPADEELHRELEAEVRENLLRIRHHACMAVLSGNNESEEMLVGMESVGDAGEAERRNYEAIFEEMFPRIVSEVCPELPYIPSSPTSCSHDIHPQDENYGDAHYWMVWHGNLPYPEYRNHFFRYLSEFGFQSFPCEKTVNAFTLPEDRNIFSRVMERHQRNSTANGKILSYLSQTFLYPTDFGTLLYASQLLQATAIRYGVEHLRRNRGRCMGTLYWQFNDIWPVASWASIDYYGRYKALQYVAKRFYAPVMISCAEVGETDSRRAVYVQPDFFDYETTAILSVNNDSMESVTGRVVWQLRDANSNVLQEGSEDVTVPALSVVHLDELDFCKTDVERNHLSFCFEVNSQAVSGGTALFTAPKHYLFADPKLTWSRSGDEITVYAQAYAQAVEIDSPDSDCILSDNYFDMEAGSRTVRIVEGDPQSITLRSVYDIR